MPIELRIKYATPSTCETCPLYEKGIGFVPDELVDKPLYTFYGEAPGKTEVEEGAPFKGQAGWVLKNWIIRAVPGIQLAIEKGRVSFKNILHCLPPEVQGRPYPKGEEKRQAEECCKQYHSEDQDAPTVILCGEVPQRYFFGEELEVEDATDKSLGHEVKGVMGRIGRIYYKNNSKYVFAPHPAYILRQPALVGHGQESLKIAVGLDRVVEPNVMKWDEAIEELC